MQNAESSVGVGSLGDDVVDFDKPSQTLKTAVHSSGLPFSFIRDFKDAGRAAQHASDAGSDVQQLKLRSLYKYDMNAMSEVSPTFAVLGARLALLGSVGHPEVDPKSLPDAESCERMVQCLIHNAPEIQDIDLLKGAVIDSLYYSKLSKSLSEDALKMSIQVFDRLGEVMEYGRKAGKYDLDLVQKDMMLQMISCMGSNSPQAEAVSKRGLEMAERLLKGGAERVVPGHVTLLWLSLKASPEVQQSAKKTYDATMNSEAKRCNLTVEAVTYQHPNPTPIVFLPDIMPKSSGLFQGTRERCVEHSVKWHGYPGTSEQHAVAHAPQPHF